MPKLRATLTAFSLIIVAVVIAHAQGAGVMSIQVGQSNGAGTGTGGGIGASAGGVIGGLISPGISGTPGQPFSADVIQETDRFLADGNHIHRENHGRVFRDSQGRTRNESEIGVAGPGMKPFVHIVINDPVEGRFILLNPEQKTATIHKVERGISGTVGSGLPVQSANNTSNSSAPTTGAASPGELSQSLRNLRAASGTQTPGKLQSTREDLGTKVIEGYTVKGTRYTHTIPAGEMGNDQPMITTTELWFSFDLKMDLINKFESPESGTHVRKLVNIHTDDPDPLLFQVPADYTVKETPQQ